MGKANGIINDIRRGIKTAFTKKLKEVIETPINKMKSFFESIMRGMKRSFEQMAGFLLIPLKYIMKALSTVTNIFKTLFRNLAKSMQRVLQLFTKAFQTIISFFMKALRVIMSAIQAAVRMVVNLFKLMGKFLKRIFLTIGKFFKKLFDEIAKFFQEVFFYILCTINKIVAFKECALYYLIDTMIFFSLLPFRFLALIFPPLRQLEDMVMLLLDKVDDLVFKTSSMIRGKDENGNAQPGFHINQWSNDILNKCYRCKPEKEDENTTNLFDEIAKAFSEGKGSFFDFTTKVSLLLFALIAGGIYLYKYFTKPSCDIV